MRLVGCFALAALLLTGCSMGSAIPAPQVGATTSAGVAPVPVQPATTFALSANSCWTGELLGSDPQRALNLATTFGVSYFDAAYALEDRPAFLETLPCTTAHAVEIYRLVPAAEVAPGLAGYSSLMQTRSTDFVRLAARVRHACMDSTLAVAARRAQVEDASLQPAVPDGFRIDWTPATPEQWDRGQQVFACLFVQDDPSSLLYSSLRSRSLPTALRTCIASGSRIYVDCARKHDRELIAVLDVSGAVAAGTLPGRSAVRHTAGGATYLGFGAAFYRPLDRACTTYLRSISTDRRLSGVAEIDADAWPDADGRYTISCEADAPANRPSKVTTGSVYDLGG
jgi:hypothetical protein